MKVPTRIERSFGDMADRFFKQVVSLLPIILILHVYELIASHALQQVQGNRLTFVSGAVYEDLVFFLFLSGCLLVVYGLLYLLSVRWATILLTAFCVAVISGQAMLTAYFLTAQNPLGADLYGYSLAEIRQTAGAALTWQMITVLLIVVIAVSAIFIFLLRHIRAPRWLSYPLLLVGLFVLFFFGIEPESMETGNKSEFLNNAMRSKSAYFYKSSFYHFTRFQEPQKLALYADSYIDNKWQGAKGDANSFVYADPEHFPFLHADKGTDVFSSHLVKGERPPDIVIIIIEGLGRAFSNPGAYLGSFTPFIDSLATHSLYWENCLSAGGRTFAVLPSILGSLPFGEHGFSEMGKNTPKHLSLINILKYNGYYSRYIYPGDANFDNMALFMQRQHTDEIIDQRDFGSNYAKLPSESSGFSWGYGDFELYQRFFKSFDAYTDKPSVNVIQTVATHSPFLVNNQKRYEAAFQKKLGELTTSEQIKTECRENHRQLETVMYMDEAMKDFFSEYSKRPSFGNTIFIITGDHRMPDIPLATKIDRYHVPLIVYSPEMKRPTKFSAIVSHLDITPSLLAFSKNSYGLSVPSLACWISSGLDTTVYFTNRHEYALMQTKEEISDFISGTSFLNGDQLFRVGQSLALEPENDVAKNERLESRFGEFKKQHHKVESMPLYPDSLLERFGTDTKRDKKL